MVLAWRKQCWTSELLEIQDNKFELFKAIKFLVICYGSNGKLISKNYRIDNYKYLNDDF